MLKNMKKRPSVFVDFNTPKRQEPSLFIKVVRALHELILPRQ